MVLVLNDGRRVNLDSEVKSNPLKQVDQLGAGAARPPGTSLRW